MMYIHYWATIEGPHVSSTRIVRKRTKVNDVYTTNDKGRASA